MSNQPDTNLLAALYRELGEIVQVPTRGETLLQGQLDSIYVLVEAQCLPGEMFIDAVRRLIRDGITYNEIREVEHLEAQQKRVQEGWAKGNGLKAD